MRSTQFFVPTPSGVLVSAFNFGGSGPVLLLCGANGFHGLCYEEMAKSLLASFRCYAVDLRGQGDSQVAFPNEAVELARSRLSESSLIASTELPTLKGFVEDITAVLDFVLTFSRSKECYLFGHSLGGTAALAAAMALPGRVHGVYAYEPVFGPASPAARDPPPKAKGYSQFRRAVLQAYVDHGFEDQPDGSCSLKCSRACEAFLYLGIKAMAVDCFEALHTIACPVTIAAGENDRTPASTAGSVHGIVKRLQKGRLEMYEHLGHMAPFVEPEFVAEKVKANLSRCARL